MVRRWQTRATWSVVGLLMAGCASSGVSVARSDRQPPATTPDTTPDTFPPAEDPDRPAESLVWSPCAEFDAPWECGAIQVPLDYHARDDDALEDERLTIAMIRRPAAGGAGERVGALLVNPGGPGGSGIELAYAEAEYFPQSMLDAFDVIGFDPRGVGRSSAVLCPSSYDPDFDSYDDCIDDNRVVLPFLGTPNAARDMDMIRRALSEEQISFLGYSYGTALGAVYADMFPERVRTMVLDGAVDPDAGLSNTSEGGSDFYADQDFDGAIAEFEALCDATTLCPAGPGTEELVSRVRRKIKDLPTDRFSNGGRLTRGDLDDILTDAMYSAFDWPILAVALADADDGDASTLAAFNSYLLYGYPADVRAENNLEFANIAIRCADFSARGGGSFECHDFPETDEPLPVITEIDVSTPILVVGTRGDPATPGRYAPLMADALGDAVAIEWEGAGHTATLTSRCITAIVAAYLVDAIVPADGATCPFVTGTTTLAGAADVVFANPDHETNAANIAGVLIALGETEDVATCVAEQLSNRADQRMIIDQLLGIESSRLVGVRSLIERGCATG